MSDLHVPNKVSDELLRVIINHIQSDEVDETLKEKVSIILANYTDQFKIVLVALVKQKISRLEHYLSIKDDIEHQLFDAVKIANAPVRDLIKMHQIITNCVNDISLSIQSANNLGIDSSIVNNFYVQHNVQNNILDGMSDMNTRSRINIEGAVGKLLRKLNSENEH